jgi:pyroglutamyl-peptidase
VTYESIIADGPAAYFVNLPVWEMQEAIQEAGIPAKMSLSVGAYPCNQVLYSFLNGTASKGKERLKPR